MKEVKPSKALEFPEDERSKWEKQLAQAFLASGASNNELKQIYLQKEMLRLLIDIREKL